MRMRERDGKQDERYAEQGTVPLIVGDSSVFKRLTLLLVKEELIEIGCVVTSLVVGCHARALWPNGAS